MAGFVNRDNRGAAKTPFTLGSTLKKLSSFGMYYDDMVLRQSQAIGPMEDALGYGHLNMGNMMGADPDNMYDTFAALSMADVSLRKNIPFFDQNYVGKREELRNFSTYDEIEDILDILCDEAIVYDNKNFIAVPEIIGMDVNEDVNSYMQKAYRSIYQYFGFASDQSVWYYFRKWLIDGFLAFEIIYSPDQKEIIGFKEIDPVTLIPGLNTEDGKKMWTQFKDDPQKERNLYDSQIVYISYSSITTASRVSYLERLVRSFNLLRIMEHTRVIWAVTNSSYRMKFVIPVGGKSKTRAKQSLSQLMSNYKEVVDFDWESASLETNGKPMLQFNKEYWLPSKDGESPEIETLSSEGPELSDTEALKYFSDKLKAVSKIPYSRFMYEDGGEEFTMAADGMIRDEIKFSKFVKRLRSSFQEILIKPLWLQMCLKFPEFETDPQFKTQIALEFNEENMFAELKQMEIMERRLDFVGAMQDSLMKTDPMTMEEMPYFDMEFLVDRYLKLSPDDKAANLAYRARASADDAKDGEDDPMAMM
jgi:hypothetical protein